MTIMCQKYTTDKNNPFMILYGDMEGFPYHWHDEIEIIYVFKGSVNFVIGTQIEEIRERDILIVKSGEVHRSFNGIDCEYIIIEFGHYLDNDIFRTQTLIYPGMPAVLRLSDTKENGVLAENSESVKQMYLEIEELILLIHKEYQQKGRAWDFMIKSALYKIVALLDREFSKMVKVQENKNIIHSYNEILHEVFRYIDNNYNKKITIDDVARVANFSKHYFNKFFKKATNKTFARYVNDVRLEKAQTLLKGSNRSITEIAFDVGFNSLKTFNRIFKERIGCTPSEYRQNHSLH